MGLFSAMRSSASALTAGRLQMDVIANNLANMNTTRTADGTPYRRRSVTLAERTEPFAAVLDRQTNQTAAVGAGVKVQAIVEDQSPFKLKYDPGNPDADAQGMVRMPNVDLLEEITSMLLASRVYEANVTAFNAGKAMAMKALDMGR